MKKKAVILYSGWADSTTVLYKLLEEWYEVYPLIVDYWQRNHKEIMRAFWILEELWLPHKLIVCPTINQICDSGLIWEWEFIWDKPDYTVHSRNLWLASMWAMYAQNIKAPYEKTCSCFNSWDTPCWKCPSCKTREESFSQIK